MSTEAPVEREYRLDGGLLRLGDPDSRPERTGSKATNLTNLIRAGFPVPDGFVLPVELFAHFVAENGLTPDSHTEEIERAVIPAEVTALLEHVVNQMGDVPLAVRSSATAEDLPDASFAGQYDTVLGVRGYDQVEDAVRRCWASAFNERVAKYQHTVGTIGVPPIAVIIQQLISADAAGVAFTVNPVSGNRNETLVSAVRGLGERLVSGEATPDEWIVRDGRVTAQRTVEQALDADQVVHIAGMARQVEVQFGAPQDIEWAIVGNQIFLLQARPVTGLDPVQPVERKSSVPDGFWVRDSAHYPHPMSPLSRSFYLRGLGSALTDAFREFGVLIDRIEAAEIGGYVYLRIVPPGGKEGPPPPWWLLGAIVRVLPSARAVMKRAREAERTNLDEHLVDQWWKTWRGELFRRIESLQSIELTDLPDDELLAQLDQRLELLQDGNNLHFRLVVPFMKAVAEFSMFCQATLGWDTPRSMELLSGLSEMSTEPARRLADLADLAKTRPAVLELLAGSTEVTPKGLHRCDAEFARAFDAYQHRFGVRALGEDLFDPTLGELPSLTLTLLRGQLRGDYDPDAVADQLATARESLLEAARTALRERPDDLSRFNRLLQKAQRAYPVREDNSFPTYQAPIGLIRYAALEIGRRLAERGSVVRSADVLFLELEEVRSTLVQGTDRTKLVERRRGEHDWALSNPGPASYGEDPGPPADLRALPSEARRLMEALFWFMENDLDAPPVQGGTGVQGVPASPGTYRGPARIVLSEEEFHKVQPGDVLVCPVTSPVWSVLFASVGALVTDVGGVLSHSAIIAREYGIPAVVATGNATATLKDGEPVTVDGSRGIVAQE